MTFFYFLKKYKKIGSDMQGWNTLNTSKHSPNPSIPFFDLWLLSPDNIGFCEKEYYSSDKNMFSSRKTALFPSCFSAAHMGSVLSEETLQSAIVSFLLRGNTLGPWSLAEHLFWL